MQSSLFGPPDPEVVWREAFAIQSTKTGLWVGPYEYEGEQIDIINALPFGRRDAAETRAKRGDGLVVVRIEYAIREAIAK
jgi:hypothetical protein